MTTKEMHAEREPLPRYAMPDGSEPEYEAILEQIQYQRKSMIGSAFFYIRAGVAENLCLCRIIPGGGKIFFHEIVDHQKYGISDEDMEDAVKYDTDIFGLPGHIHISPHIESKLRTLLDAE
ncbi:MAG TPA: hypothetical protein PKM50_09525 [Methanoregula sp.]|nr:hypothetical protein [Methanoregula sp.]